MKELMPITKFKRILFVLAAIIQSRLYTESLVINSHRVKKRLLVKTGVGHGALRTHLIWRKKQYGTGK